jgi:hypothetical protein
MACITLLSGSNTGGSVRLWVQRFWNSSHAAKGAWPVPYMPALPLEGLLSISGPDVSFFRAVNELAPSVSYTLHPAGGRGQRISAQL